MNNQNAQPTPEQFYAGVNAFHLSGVLKGAIELDLFTVIAEGHKTVKDISEKCKSAERGIRILCDYLVIHGFLIKHECQYELTQNSAIFLDRRSPAYLGLIVEFLMSPTLIEAYSDVAGAVRRGGTVLSDEGTMSEENLVWVKFARAMVPVMMAAAKSIAELAALNSDKKCKVLDIAAGHGIFGISFAQQYKNVEVTAVDWAPVLEVAKENAQHFGVADRFNTIAGSVFDVDLGSDYDVVLFPNFLHHFDVATCETILKKVHSALNPGGRVFTLEFVPNEDRVTPLISAIFAMTMLVSTKSGDAYTFDEYDRMFKNAGFASSELREIQPPHEQLIVSYK